VSTRFLALDEVVALHAALLKYGGDTGVRDFGLLQSALAMPEASFDGALLHATLHEQAAAYLFHLVKNHPFVDGNKRVALAAALVFLDLNGAEVRATEDELVDLTVAAASGGISKSEIAVFLAAKS
jgi:death-on-curing protein